MEPLSLTYLGPVTRELLFFHVSKSFTKHKRRQRRASLRISINSFSFTAGYLLSIKTQLACISIDQEASIPSFNVLSLTIGLL